MAKPRLKLKDHYLQWVRWSFWRFGKFGTPPAIVPVPANGNGGQTNTGDGDMNKLIEVAAEDY